MPSVARLRVLCEVLDLDFYIGPRREAGAVDEARLFEAVVAMERALAAGAISLTPRARAVAIVEVYGVSSISSGRRRPRRGFSASLRRSRRPIPIAASEH